MKNNTTKVNEMMNLLDKAYNDPAINKRPDLKKMILDYAMELDKEKNVDLFSTRISKRISLEYLENKQDFPKTIMDIYFATKGKAMKYDSTAFAAFAAGNIWF